MKNLLIIIFVVVLFGQEVLIFKKKNWNMLVEKVGESSSKIIDNFRK